MSYLYIERASSQTQIQLWQELVKRKKERMNERKKERMNEWMKERKKERIKERKKERKKERGDIEYVKKKGFFRGYKDLEIVNIWSARRQYRVRWLFEEASKIGSLVIRICVLWIRGKFLSICYLFREVLTKFRATSQLFFGCYYF